MKTTDDFRMQHLQSDVPALFTAAPESSTLPATFTAFNESRHHAPAAPVLLHETSGQVASSIVFVDSRLPDYQQIVDAVKPGSTVVVLDKNQDGIKQIADVLQHVQNLDSISIVSHGAQGVLLVGDGVLHSGDLGVYQHELKTIGAALKTSGDILLYGCDVGAGSV
ncbi:MAG: DUF4347 domain-containing protein, partial [Burkholderiales bacterium]|nr:DUF4347 domain-containing protein [Burkholderiales bacterium]